MIVIMTNIVQANKQSRDLSHSAAPYNFQQLIAS